MIMAQKGSADCSGGRPETCEQPRETVVMLKLGSIPKSTAQDIKKWIESFGEFEFNNWESGKLAVTGKMDPKRLLTMVPGKSPMQTGGADIKNLNRGCGGMARKGFQVFDTFLKRKVSRKCQSYISKKFSCFIGEAVEPIIPKAIRAGLSLKQPAKMSKLGFHGYSTVGFPDSKLQTRQNE